MIFVCIDDSGIKQSERSFHNCLYQTNLGSSLTYGKQYMIYLCKRPGEKIQTPKGISSLMDKYFSIKDDEFKNDELTWVEVFNDDNENEWYYLDRFTPLDVYRNSKLNEIGI